MIRQLEKLNKKSKKDIKFIDENDIDILKEMSIEDILKSRAEERKSKLKNFNHKFNNPNRIDDLEKEPAFRRLGLDVTSMPNQNPPSRMSIGMDINYDMQLRSNNSFLHDNVD